MIGPDAHERLMATDIVYVRTYLSAERDQALAVMYEALKELSGDKWPEKFDEIQNRVLDKRVLGGLFPVKPEYVVWKPEEQSSPCAQYDEHVPVEFICRGSIVKNQGRWQCDVCKYDYGSESLAEPDRSEL